MSPLQKKSLLACILATARGHWYRAGADERHGSAAGERVTLASLYRAGVLERRVWRGSGPHAAHEYQATAEVMSLWREKSGATARPNPERDENIRVGRTESARPHKPHAADAGYVAERKSNHPKLPGHFVIYDRDAEPPPDIDADDRWVVMHVPGSAMVSCTNLRLAREVMAAMASGSDDFDFGQHEVDSPQEER
ncbi:hypothetical protein [Nannocystis pusilla]|uniref:hypothetical protein n=1 Tax=Nannocystis pusilla TaxID=889268 RepID=UPI003B7BF45A